MACESKSSMHASAQTDVEDIILYYLTGSMLITSPNE